MVNVTKMSKCEKHLKEMVAAAENRNVITLHKGKICKDTHE